MVTAALMAACSTEENGMGANKDAVSISTRVTLDSGPAQMRSDGTPQARTDGTPQARTDGTPQTRADGTSAYTSANATLTLCYGSVGSGQKSTFTCASGNWSTTQPLYWQDLKPAGGTYAFFAVVPEMPGDVHKGEVKKDQSNSSTNGKLLRPAGTSSINKGGVGSTRAAGALTAFEASDLLMAYQTTTKSGTLDLNLKHLLSQLQVKLVSVSGSDGLTAAELASATLTIDGLKTQYSLAYTGSNGDATIPTIPSTACPALATATADAAATGLTPYTDGTGNAKNFRFIAPAQTLTAGALTLRFTLTIGGTAHSYTYTSTGQEMNLTAGAITLLTITASRTAATLAGVSVTGWSPLATISGTVGITITGSADTPTGSAPAFSTMKMWMGKKEFTAANGGSAPGTSVSSEPDKTEVPADAHLYSRNNGSWTDASPTPFYVDDVASTDLFYALAENTGPDGNTAIHDTKTGLKDPVAAGPTSMNGGAVALTYSHLLAKLRITLTASGNFSANLAGATISSPAMLPGYTLSYSTDDAITATATGTPAEYLELSAGTDYIVVPQTVSGDFIVALDNGNTYTAKLSSLTLEAGKITTLALTLNLTQTTIKVAVTDWSAGSTANETISIGSISSTGGVSGNDGSFTPAIGDKLDIADAGNSATGTYTYGSSWTSTAPLYWDALNPSGSPYTFNALFTPVTGTDTDAGLVKDYQGGTVSGVTLGNELSFTLSHLMAQVSVTVKPGKGYEDAMAGEITVSLNNLKKLTHINTDGTLTLDDATGALTLDNPTEDDGGGSGNNGNAGNKSFTATALIAPQAVTAGTVLVTVGIKGSNYTLKAPAQSADGFAYLPGRKNSITLTINKSEATLSFKVEGWDTTGSTTEGDGELVEPTTPK